MHPNTRSRLALAAVWTIAAWVLVGATFKLFWGNPALLPEIVRDLPLELGVTYNLAIGIELAIVGVALTKPRWGWVLEALLLLVFDVVLVTQIAAGVTNCGCFGAKLSVPPWLMLTIDSVLLAALLASRPWARLGPGLMPVVPVVLGAVALALPWFLDREVKQTESLANDGSAPGAAPERPVVPENAWIELDVESWVGTDIFDTPLGRPPLDQYLDVNALPLDGLWVFYRQTCEHCEKHLAWLADQEVGARPVTLVQLEEPNDSLANRVVNRMPDGNFVKHASLPPTISYLLETPAELVLEAGRVVTAAEGVHAPGEAADAPK